MKIAMLLAFLAIPMLGQEAGSTVILFDSDITNYVFTPLPPGEYGNRPVFSVDAYQVVITRKDDQTEAFTFRAERCYHPILILKNSFNHLDPSTSDCKPLSESDAKRLAPVAADLVTYYKLAPEVEHGKPKYKTSVVPARPSDILVPKVARAPQLLFFDGRTFDFLKYNLSTNQISTLVTLVEGTRLFAVRPTPTDNDEVWVSHGGTGSQISIVDMNAGKVLGTIPITSVDRNNTEPTGLVFTNDGRTALLTANFFQPDAAGNRGALLVLNAATRKVTSTQLLTFAPQALVMSPDGLTAYLSDSQRIVYYDVLSGTSDLSAPFDYGRPVLIHPDGTRLYLNQSQQVSFFDLTTRKFIAQPKFNFPGNASAVSMRMSQDGAILYATDGRGNVVMVGTRYGEIVTSYKTRINTTDPADNNTQVLPVPRI